MKGHAKVPPSPKNKEDEMSETNGASPGDPDAGGPDEGQIREIAYFLWIEEGCPEGRAEDHWMMACATLSVPPTAMTVEEPEAPASP